MNKQKGIAPIIIIALIVLASGGVFAVVERNVLKEYFEKGDKPTASQRTVLKDEFKDGDIPTEPDFVDKKKPASTDFKDTLDSALNMHDDGLAKPNVEMPSSGTPSAGTSTPLPVSASVLAPAQVLAPERTSEVTISSSEGSAGAPMDSTGGR